MKESTTIDPMPVKSRLEDQDAARVREPMLHIYRPDGDGPKVVCRTDSVGHATPGDLPPDRLVVDATEGFVPLWGSDVTLRWRFQPQSMAQFVDPPAAMTYLRDLMARGLLLWKDAVPIKFKEAHDAWDFEIAVNGQPDCDINGCVLASAFFPDGGQHELRLFPTLFDQPFQEQVETMAHELGHVFGLRHFFAQIDEKRWASEIFGKHEPFSIMNYGSKSVMTKNDREDLELLYQLARSGDLKDINGTPVQLVRPFSALRPGVLPAECIPAAAVAVAR